MRTRLLILVLAILLVAGFAAQNWPEFTRPVPLNVAVTTIEAPLGLIMLVVLGIALLVFIAGAASLRTQSLIESRRQSRALHAQRELADNAEASRFTDLRQMLDTHLRSNRSSADLDKTLAQHQRELRNQLEQMYHLLTSRLSELERRMDGRNGRTIDPDPALRGTTTPVTPVTPVNSRMAEPGLRTGDSVEPVVRRERA